MRIACGGTLLINLLCCGSLLEGKTFPYTVEVTADVAAVRSGPGEHYYPTNHLPRGNRVEVYRDNGQGWLAIRPPAGSFCWVEANYLKPTDQENVAEVNADDVPASIGTNLSDIRGVVQVQLRRGEQVEILGTQETQDGYWCKITPPAGEFRWVRDELVGADSVGPASEAPIEPGPLTVVDAGPVNPDGSDSNDSPVGLRGEVIGLVGDDQPSSVDQAGWMARRDRSDLPSGKQPQRVARSNPRQSAIQSRKHDTASDATRQTIPQRESSSFLTENDRAGSSSRLQADAIDSQFVKLQLQLSRTVSGHPASWRLESLRSRANQIVRSAPTSRQRARARLLLEKIAEFEDVRLRYEQLAVFSDDSGLQIDDVEPIGSGVSRPGAPEQTDAQYNGSGWLMPVVTRRPDVPRYALTDDYGRVLQFITPMPGLNIRRYLRKQIGVQGTNRDLPQLDRPHLVAERVIQLDRHQR